jgi:hypothetical protein
MTGALPLRTLCENVLLKNHLSIRDLGDVRYGLIKRVLSKFTSQQLIILEERNPMLVLEDDNSWLCLLQKDYPQDVHDKFTSQPQDVRRFYKRQLKSMDVDPASIKLDNYIQLQELSNTKQYRLPYKQVYLEIRQHYIDKQEEAVVNLRKNMQKMAASKDVNKVIHLDQVIPVGRPRPLPIKRVESNRTPLFQKAQVEAKKRRQLFQNPLSLMPKRTPPRLLTPQKANITPNITQRVNDLTQKSNSTIQKKIAATSVISPPAMTQTRPSSPIATRPIKASSNIFVPKKQVPRRMISKRPLSNATSPASAGGPSGAVDLSKVWKDQERTVKKIKLDDYIKRKNTMSQ